LGNRNKDVKYDSSIGSQNFIKGENTASLISSLVDHTIRNNNMVEVYERLKFLSKECFRTQEKEIYFFTIILSEIDLYLKSYDEENEDSDWDSDEEVWVIKIVKKLKSAIEEKQNLVHKLDEIERSLIAYNSSFHLERNNSIFYSSYENSLGGSLSFHKDSSKIRSEETYHSKERNLKIESESSSLYKNVLKKRREHVANQPNSQQQSPTKINNFLSSDSTNWNQEEVSSTPKASPQKAVFESRMNQKVNSITVFAPRSSSIQSIRSNTSTINSKKTKNRNKALNKLTALKVSGKRDHSRSSDYSWESSPKSAALVVPLNFSSKNEGNILKPIGKGLSSFAKKRNAGGK